MNVFIKFFILIGSDEASVVEFIHSVEALTHGFRLNVACISITRVHMRLLIMV